MAWPLKLGGRSREEVVGIVVALSAVVLDLITEAWYRPHAGWAERAHDALIVILLAWVAGYLGAASLVYVRRKVKEIADIVTKETKLMAWKSDKSVQYGQAAELLEAEEPCDKIFLMQHSSTLILGPEDNSAAEKRFYTALNEKIKKKNTNFYHVVSLEGIERHLTSPKARFSRTREALRGLAQDKDGKIFPPGDRKQGHCLKRIRDSSEGVKPDKQARVLVIGRPGETAEALMVLDLGSNQSYFHLRGPKMREYLDDCIYFYDNECQDLTVQELEDKVPALRGLADGIKNDPGDGSSTRGTTR